ncbi:FxsB family cyclophane-forming radical SAM/SPASM peptide maturase [Micromonospora sp. C51]|uniref:FxsB family cyclophane-forming radical SAM/SPASM peptide maturase n=1 Tax=Micromonospora sp. C51 TaxID=2824879 RepID=UPI0027DD115E|nr:FxsB family cyclophane-forming radical SAM/SPASM peptide maturase [Micromonospora sp. C51]
MSTTPGESDPWPPPLHQYVLKVHSRCDLACDHCYVYEHADQSWRARPRKIAPETVAAAALRIAEHARERGLHRVNLVLHGGEPLLLGAAGLAMVLTRLRAAIEPVAELDLRMQSNGVLLSPQLCDLFVEHGVRVGISLDGDATANDRHRRFANGASSHAQVRRALALLRRPEYRRCYAGILCTIDVRNDPVQVYRALLAEAPPRIDFLLPHATWVDPPPRPGGATSYADWLLPIYRRWVRDGRPVDIRLFDSLLAAAAGGRSGTEAVGLDPSGLAVIETDGTWELADSMKTAFDGAAGTGLDVFRHSANVLAAHPEFARSRRGLTGLCQTCRDCSVVGQCGGGLRAHRYSAAGGFDNPSVYCADLKKLIVTMNDESPETAVAARSTGLAGDRLLDGLPAADLLDDLGTGHGSGASLHRLAAAQLAYVRGLLVQIADRVAGTPLAEAWELIVRLDEEATEAVSATFAHPYLRRWARRCLAPVAGEAPDWAYLGALAAAAAVRAGVDTDIEVPVRSGLVHLPGLGAQAIDEPGERSARLSIAGGGFTARAGRSLVTVPPAGATPPAGWAPVRQVELSGWTLLIDDIDPYRDCYQWPVTGRLDPAQLASWRRSLAAAWARIEHTTPGQIAGLRAGLRTVTPLRVDPGGRLRSAASRDAFGALGTVPAAPDPLAELLVHEFQHVKLGAVLDVSQLYDPAYRKRLSVPWRDDPRPLEGVLQGTYAHLAVADIWRARPGPLARQRHRRYRGWTVRAIDELAGTGALTEHGHRFVRRMRQTVDSWSDDPR